jgi:hypothetical protein
MHVGIRPADVGCESRSVPKNVREYEEVTSFERLLLDRVLAEIDRLG